MDPDNISLPSGRTLKSLKVADLQKELKKRRQSTIGKKAELLERLAHSIMEESGQNESSESAQPETNEEELSEVLNEEAPEPECIEQDELRCITPKSTHPLLDVTQRASSRKRRSGTFDVPEDMSRIEMQDDDSVEDASFLSNDGQAGRQSVGSAQRMVLRRRTSEIRRSILSKLDESAPAPCPSQQLLLSDNEMEVEEEVSSRRSAKTATPVTKKTESPIPISSMLPSSVLVGTPSSNKSRIRAKLEATGTPGYSHPTTSSAARTSRRKLQENGPLLGPLITRSRSSSPVAGTPQRPVPSEIHRTPTSRKRLLLPRDGTEAPSAKSPKIENLPSKPPSAKGPVANRFASAHKKLMMNMETLEEQQNKVVKRHEAINSALPSFVKRLATPKRGAAAKQAEKPDKENQPMPSSSKGFAFTTNPHAEIMSDTFNFGPNAERFEAASTSNAQTSNLPRPTRMAAKNAAAGTAKDVKAITKATTRKTCGAIKPLTRPVEDTFTNYISAPKGVTPAKTPNRSYTPHRGAIKKFVDTTKLSDRDFDVAVEAGLVRGPTGFKSANKKSQAALEAESRRVASRDAALEVKRKLKI